MKSAAVEKNSPLIIGVLFSLTCTLIAGKEIIPFTLKQMASVSILFSGLAILMISQSIMILFASSNKVIAAKILVPKAYERLVDYFMGALNWSLIAIAFDVLVAGVDFEKQLPGIAIVTFLAWMIIFTTSVFSLFRTVYLCALFLKSFVAGLNSENRQVL